MHTTLNTKNTNSSIYDFYFSINQKNNYNNYYIRLVIPNIHINYKCLHSIIQKDFALDIKRMKQINKLRHSFLPQDLIKYSIKLVKKNKKQNNKNNDVRLSTIKLLKLRRNSTSTEELRNFPRNSIRNSTVKSVNYESRSIIKKNKNKNKNDTKDIEINLDKYIFNFDKGILKFIKPYNKKIEENENQNVKIDSQGSLKLTSVRGENKESIKIDIGNIKIIILDQKLDEIEHYFEKAECEKLMDFSFHDMENYIQDNIDEYIKSKNN